MSEFEGHGTTVAFAAAGTPAGLLAEIVDIGGGEMSRGAINVTTYSDAPGGEIFIPTRMHDPGEYALSCLFEPGIDPSAVMNLAKASLTITHSDSGAAVWVIDGFVMRYGFALPYQDRAVGNIVFKLSGDAAVTP